MQRPLLWESFDVYFRRTYMNTLGEETQMNVDKDNRQTYNDKVSNVIYYFYKVNTYVTQLNHLSVLSSILSLKLFLCIHYKKI